MEDPSDVNHEPWPDELPVYDKNSSANRIAMALNDLLADPRDRLGLLCDHLVKIWRELEKYRELEAKARLLEPSGSRWVN